MKREDDRQFAQELRTLRRLIDQLYVRQYKISTRGSDRTFSSLFFYRFRLIYKYVSDFSGVEYLARKIQSFIL